MGSALMGLLAGGITGLSTMLGALPILKEKTTGWNPWRSLNLDFAIGMMLAAAAFNLIAPAYSSSHSAFGVSLALALGVASSPPETRLALNSGILRQTVAPNESRSLSSPAMALEKTRPQR